MNYATQILAYLRAHPGRAVLAIGVAVGLVVAGHFFGPRVVERDHWHETVISHTEWKAVVVERAAETKYTDRTVTHTEYDPACHGVPTSTTVTHETTGEHSETVVDSRSEGASDSRSETDATRSKETNPRPRWHFSLGLGLSPLRLGDLTALGTLEYRIAGPFTIGAWTALHPYDLSASTIGLSLGIDF